VPRKAYPQNVVGDMAPPDLFGDADLPPGFFYRPDLITPVEEQDLLSAIGALEFSAVEMRGVVARRRTVHFGWTYGYYARRTEPGQPLPAFLLPLRARMAEWSGVAADAFEEALLTEYPPGAPIGWHRDAPMFGDVVAGASLASSCRMKFRPYVSPGDAAARGTPRRTTHEIELAPRSGYLMTGIARRDYEHSIPPVGGMRYSITFRTVRR
jgi:alkylated DNA repair protein (DNA oxidative demethylase)